MSQDHAVWNTGSVHNCYFVSQQKGMHRIAFHILVPTATLTAPMASIIAWFCNWAGEKGFIIRPPPPDLVWPEEGGGLLPCFIH